VKSHHDTVTERNASSIARDFACLISVSVKNKKDDVTLKRKKRKFYFPRFHCPMGSLSEE